MRAPHSPDQSVPYYYMYIPSPYLTDLAIVNVRRSGPGGFFDKAVPGYHQRVEYEVMLQIEEAFSGQVDAKTQRPFVFIERQFAGKMVHIRAAWLHVVTNCQV